MTKLWLVRHGQTDWNLTGRWQGQASDAPGLNETGRKQALDASEQMEGIEISAIYSSDLLRAKQTAEMFAVRLGLPVLLEPRLREINLGVWEGMPSEDIEAQYPQELADRARRPFRAHAPDGESPYEVAERVIKAVNEIADKHRDESVLIVAHGISLAVVICQAERFPVEDVYQHIPDNAKPYCVDWDVL
ncbi:MAG: histidine phosphatase family protein [Anaerolineales bacterium]|nr:histidine phosphatase family protein [Anaerolineales bacterium]